MIRRLWSGWTSRDEADAYERLLREEIVPEIESRDIDGYEGFSVLRRDAGDEVEFLTIMAFRSLDAVRAFAGDDPEAAYVPGRARDLLLRFDDRVRHFRRLGDA